jgi:hypothetical protein
MRDLNPIEQGCPEQAKRHLETTFQSLRASQTLHMIRIVDAKVWNALRHGASHLSINPEHPLANDALLYLDARCAPLGIRIDEDHAPEAGSVVSIALKREWEWSPEEFALHTQHSRDVNAPLPEASKAQGLPTDPARIPPEQDVLTTGSVRIDGTNRGERPSESWVAMSQDAQGRWHRDHEKETSEGYALANRPAWARHGLNRNIPE